MRTRMKIPGKVTGTEGTHEFSLLEPGLSPPESGRPLPFSVHSMQPLSPHVGSLFPTRDPHIWTPGLGRVLWTVSPDTPPCFLDGGTMRGGPLGTNDCV